MMGPHYIWLVVVGGADDNKPISHTNITMMIELGKCVILLMTCTAYLFSFSS